MTTLARPFSQVERLRAFAREFADALPSPHPLQDQSFAREFWLVLVSLVVDQTAQPQDLTDDPIIAIYATVVAADFVLDEALS